jgi:transposase
MNIKLSQTTRAELISQHKRTRDKRVCDRIKAVLAYDEGYSYADIAKILLLDDSTIRRHLDDYISKEKLTTDNGGSDSMLSEIQSDKLIMELKTFTYLRVKDICAYVKKVFSIRYTIGGMTKWLHRKGFTYKKPQPVPAKADAVAQQKFIEYYEDLKKEANNEPIYFADSVHPQHKPRLTSGWILKGELKLMPINGSQKRLNIIGGINLSDHNLVFNVVDTVNALSIENFLKALRKKHSSDIKLHLVLDNAGYHRAERIIKAAEDLNIKLHYLPPYSPNLNPIERLWKIMHEYVTYNQYYEKFKDFKDATLNFLKTISRKKKLLRARINDNFNLLQSPIFAGSS